MGCSLSEKAYTQDLDAPDHLPVLAEEVVCADFVAIDYMSELQSCLGNVAQPVKMEPVDSLHLHNAIGQARGRHVR